MPIIRATAIAMLFLLLGFAVRSSPVSATALHCAPDQEPGFSLGFADLKLRLGDTMGEPLECEHSDFATGDALQTTTTGLAFYRSRTNIPMFTDGWKHWALTGSGLVSWEGEAIDPPGDLFPAVGATTAAPAGGPRLSTESLVARNDAAVLRVVVPSGCASAFLVTYDGYAVTNQHVVTTNSTVEVWLRDGRQMLVPVLTSDEENDLALIKLPGTGYTSVRFGSSTDLALGSGLALLGHPVTAERATVTCSTELTVSTGILSSRASQFGLSWLQTDAALNPGVSGGAAFDLAAALVGIPTAGFDPGFADNVGFLIPSDRARPIVDNWIRAHRAGALPTPPDAAAAVTVRERGAFELWEEVTGRITGTDVERWTVDAVAGDYLLFDVFGFDTFLRLYDPDGALLDEDDDSGFLSGSRLRYLVGTSGTYSVEVSAVRGRAGEYALYLEPLASSLRGAVAVDQPLNAFIGSGGADLWTFEGQAGQFLRIDAWGFDTYLRLYGPGGQALQENDDALPDFGSSISIPLFETGVYSIEVTGVFGDSGSYTLLTSAATGRERGAIPGPDDEVTGTIAAGEVELWSFEGREGFHVRLETWGMDTVMALYSPGMQLLAEDDDGATGTGSLIRQLLPSTGTYWVVVRGYDLGAGDYKLVYTGAGSGAPD